MLEKNVWAWLRDGTRTIKGLHMVRMESPITPGFPDVEGQLLNAGGFTLELKKCYRPARMNSQLQQLKIREKQLDFLEERAKCGGSAWMLIRVCTRGPNVNYLIPGNSIHFLRTSNRALIPITETRLKEFAVRNIDFSKAEQIINFIAIPENMFLHAQDFRF